MNVDILKIFVTVVEQKHFSRAAELLNLSQLRKRIWNYTHSAIPEARSSDRGRKHIIYTRKANALSL